MLKEIKKYKYMNKYSYTDCESCKPENPLYEEGICANKCDKGKIFVPEYVEFQFKPVNTRFRLESEQLKEKLYNLMSLDTKEFELEQLKYPKDSAEYQYFTNKIQERKILISKNWISDDINQKELFEKCLIGDLTQIDYSGTDDIIYLSTLGLAGQVLGDFFSMNSMQTK